MKASRKDYIPDPTFRVFIMDDPMLTVDGISGYRTNHSLRATVHILCTVQSQKRRLAVQHIFLFL